MNPWESPVAAGLALGLASALSPGPLLALLVSETLRHGARHAWPISLVPPITDAPIIAVSLILLGQVSRLPGVLGVLSFLGAGFLIVLAYENLSGRGPGAAPADPRALPLVKGLTVNILNPNAYIFWFVVGAPLVFSAWRLGWLQAAAFLAGFYLSLVGSNLLITVLAGRSRDLLAGRGYAWIMRGLGVILLAFAWMFIRRGLSEFGWR